MSLQFWNRAWRKRKIFCILTWLGGSMLNFRSRLSITIFGNTLAIPLLRENHFDFVRDTGKQNKYASSNKGTGNPKLFLSWSQTNARIWFRDAQPPWGNNACHICPPKTRASRETKKNVMKPVEMANAKEARKRLATKSKNFSSNPNVASAGLASFFYQRGLAMAREGQFYATIIVPTRHMLMTFLTVYLLAWSKVIAWNSGRWIRLNGVKLQPHADTIIYWIATKSRTLSFLGANFSLTYPSHLVATCEVL